MSFSFKGALVHVVDNYCEIVIGQSLVIDRNYSGSIKYEYEYPQGIKQELREVECSCGVMMDKRVT